MTCPIALTMALVTMPPAHQTTVAGYAYVLSPLHETVWSPGGPEVDAARLGQAADRTACRGNRDGQGRHSTGSVAPVTQRGGWCRPTDVTGRSWRTTSQPRSARFPAFATKFWRSAAFAVRRSPGSMVGRRSRCGHRHHRPQPGAGGRERCNEAGGRNTPGALTNMWHRLTTTASVRPIRLHDARHSMAVITKWLGHADASITAKINAHRQMDDCFAERARRDSNPQPSDP